MKTVVVYESMYGNTHEIAEAIGMAAREHGEAVVVPVAWATKAELSDADLIVVGGPTHAHSLSSTMTRRSAVAEAAKKGLTLDPDAYGEGLRDWFDDLEVVAGVRAAAFDTRLDSSPILTGRASKAIGKHLRGRGYRLVVEPESFLVDATNHLLAGEVERARVWGACLFAPAHV